MAIYVTSDAHGHVRALDEALSKISLTSDDTLYVLGDMIDRGPDPVGVIKLVRSLPNAHVLKGNHEQIMLDAIIGQDQLDAETWDINGGWTTRQRLNDMEFEAYEELVRWMATLPLYAVAETEERPYLLVHAGIQTEAARNASGSSLHQITRPRRSRLMRPASSNCSPSPFRRRCCSTR